jgi:hypothetical protein
VRAEHPTPFPVPFPTPLPIPDPRPEPMPGTAPDPEPAPEPRPEPTPGPTPDAGAARRVGRRYARAAMLALVVLALVVLAPAGLAACRGNEEEEREREAERLARIGERVARIERLNNAAYGLCREALQGVLLVQPGAAVTPREEVQIVRTGDTLVVRGWVVSDTTSSPRQRRGWTCTMPVRDTTVNRASVSFDP